MNSHPTRRGQYRNRTQTSDSEFAGQRGGRRPKSANRALARTSARSKIARDSGEMTMARAFLGCLCLLPLLCCGPYTTATGEEGAAAPAGAGSAVDGGSGVAQDGGSAVAQDGGGAVAQDGGGVAAEDGGSAPSILSVHDLHVDGI